MKLREWTLEGTITRNGKPLKIYTTPAASCTVAYNKLCHAVSADKRFAVRLVKGEIVIH